MLDIPEYILVYGFLVLRAHLWWVAAGVLVLALACALWPTLERRAPRRLQLLTASVGLLLLYWLGFVGAVTAARADYIEQHDSDYRAFPRVRVVLDPDNIKEPAADLDPKVLSEGCQRLLLQNNDRLFLLRPFKGAPAADLAELVVASDAVRALRILPDNTSCP